MKISLRPILFNTDMVKAILDGRKTQTRRIIKLTPGFSGRQVGESGNQDNPLGFMYPCGIKRPPCNKGDILWVRETWSTTDKCGLYPAWPTTGTHYMYKADDPYCEAAKEARWFPSILMPKEAARIFLSVKDVHVEHLQEITPSDIDAEGCKEWAYSATTGELLPSMPTLFSIKWDKTVKKADLPYYGWKANPWVWVIEFERCEKPERWPM